MTLATHAVIGAAAGYVFRAEPAAALAAAFASHLLFDIVPHWDYSLASSIHPKSEEKFKADKRTLADLFKIGADALTGIIIALAVFNGMMPPWLIILSAAAGIFPDFLQFIYKVGAKFLWPLQRFHDLIQSFVDLKRRPAAGILLQAAIALGAVLVSIGEPWRGAAFIVSGIVLSIALSEPREKHLYESQVR